MGVRFEDPLWLALALLATPLALLALRWLHAMSRARAWSAIALRTLVIALLAGALAGATAVRSTERLAVIGVVDVSESVRRFAEFGASDDGRRIAATEAARRWLEDAAADMGPDDLLGVVVFDGGRAAMLMPSRTRPVDLNLDVRITEGANIAEAIRFAAALAPPDATRRLVLISDGGQTSGDALRAANELARAGTPTPIDVVPVEYNVRREIIVEAVDAPPQAAEEATVTVRVELRATERAAGRIRLLREGRPARSVEDPEGRGRRVEFGPGRHVELFRVTLPPGRVHRFEAVFEPDTDDLGNPIGDTIAANNRAEAFTITPGRGAALLIDGVSMGDPSGAGRTLALSLERAGMEVHTVPPGGAPADALSLEAYDLVILQNVAAIDLDRGAQSLLATYVHDMGGGLIMVGGPDSFGAGGWKGTAIEPVLPVLLDLPEQMVVPSAAIMLVIDSSGSMSSRVMGGLRSQQEIANEAAALAMLSMDKRDLVGVLEFNSANNIVVPLAPNVSPQQSAQRVRSIAPGGGTNMYPALERAGRMLDTIDAQVKHVILLSDGVSMGDPGDGRAIAAAMADRGVTVSTIAVGDGADWQTLSDIAFEGGGEHYRVIDPNLLPRVFMREINIVRKPLIREAPFTPVEVASGSPVMLGAPRPIPQLLGLVLTQRRPARGVVVALQTPDGEPVLAHWNVGLGRVGAFTSDAHRWAEPWLGWPGYQTLWSQFARAIARPAASRDFTLNIDEEGEELVVHMEALDDDGRPMDLLTVPGVVYLPDGTTETLRLSQSGPGVYTARVRADRSGNYVVALTPRQGENALPPVVGGVSRATNPELRRLRSDSALLRRIAETTGGRVLDIERPQDANLFDRAGVVPVRAPLPIWHALVAWCVGFFLLDVATRRVAWDRLISREVAAELARMASEATKGRGGRAAATSGALRSAKSRAHAARTVSDGASPAPTPTIPLANRARADARAGASGGMLGPTTRGGPVARQVPPAPPAPSPTTPEPIPDDRSDTASSLLRAKRRAQARFSDTGPENGGPDPG